jgi:hypothetical protein
MQLFLKLFEPYLQWFYHCFDRIVINGYLSFLTRENNVAYFFREVCKKPKITKEVLIERTRQYQSWVANYARNHRIPLVWAENIPQSKGSRFLAHRVIALQPSFQFWNGIGGMAPPQAHDPGLACPRIRMGRIFFHNGHHIPQPIEKNR